MKDLIKKILAICAVVGSFGGGAYVMSSGIDCEISKRSEKAVDKALSYPIPLQPEEQMSNGRKR